MKKLLIILLLITLSSCKTSEEVTSRSTITWYVNFSWYQDDFEDSLVAKTIEDKFNVDLQIVSPTGDADRKLTSMINQDKLTDLITLEWWNPEVDDLIAADQVYALNQLAQEYDINFSDNIDELVYDYHALDGNLYYYPNAYFLPEDYANDNYQASNQCFLVRKDIYEAIGSPDMSTISGYYDAIVKAKALYPDVSLIGAHEFNDNGSVSFDEYLMNFLAIPYLKDGEYYDRFTDPEYLAWLKMFNQLYQEGYIDETIFTDKREQVEEKLNDGGYFTMIYQRTDIEYPEINLYHTNPEMVYIAVDGPANSNHDDPVLPGIGINGWCDTMISKSSNYPQLSMEIMNFLLSEEGQKLLYLGVEKTTYTINDQQEVEINSDLEELYENNRSEFNAQYGFMDTYWMLEQTRVNLKWQQDIQAPLAQMANWAKSYTVYPIAEINVNDDIYNNIENKINNLWSQTLIDLLTSSDEESFDKTLTNFINQRDSYNYSYYQQVKTQAILKNMQGLVTDDE